MMTFEIERLFRMWIRELENDGEWVQAGIVETVLKAFILWYEG